LQRRKEILDAIGKSEAALSASALAERFNVSRQIIVGDIALLRAGGADITATARGYMPARAAGLIKTIVCVHTLDGMRDELNVIVDNGCTALDVAVEHPIYGEIRGGLNISSRFEVEEFMEKLQTREAAPLSALTGGVHLHGISCPDESAFERVNAQLEKLGILFSAD